MAKATGKRTDKQEMYYLKRQVAKQEKQIEDLKQQLDRLQSNFNRLSEGYYRDPMTHP